MGTLKNNELSLKSSIEFPCSYIKGKLEKRTYVNLANDKSGGIISELTKLGFRRNYNHMYIPSCNDCNSCVSSRLNIKQFEFSKNNKRNLKKNDDLILKTYTSYSSERFKLFRLYCNVRHSTGQMKLMSEEEFISFFHKTINKTMIYDLTDKNNKLYGSILLDDLADGCSAVYSFFDPKEIKRGLGKNLILRTINRLKKLNKKFLYLGYWIKESKNMNYKSSFNSMEYFVNGSWVNKSSILQE
tara:strand:+ start:141 stop:869 length:729 start_codon:yes stop_codon:yes gene_type:complete